MMKKFARRYADLRRNKYGIIFSFECKSFSMVASAKYNNRIGLLSLPLLGSGEGEQLLKYR